MSRYIDADAFIKEIVNIQDLRRLSIATLGAVLHKIPTADVVEVKHGEWEPLDTTSTSRQCSACGFVFGDVRMITQSPSTTMIEHDYNFAFCPMCGADMRGEKDAEL